MKRSTSNCCLDHLLLFFFACAVPTSICGPASRLHMDQHLTSNCAAAALPLCLLHVPMGECRPCSHPVRQQACTQGESSKLPCRSSIVSVAAHFAALPDCATRPPHLPCCAGRSREKSWKCGITEPQLSFSLHAGISPVGNASLFVNTTMGNLASAKGLDVGVGWASPALFL